MMKSRLKALVPKLIDSESTTKLMLILAGEEQRLLKAARVVDEQHGIGIVTHVPDPEHRAEMLKRLLAAMVTDDFREFWIENRLDTVLDTTDGIESILGDRDAYADLRDDVIGVMRERGRDDPRADLWADYVGSKWGVSVDRLESEVVEWHKGTAARKLFAGNLRAAYRVLRVVGEIEDRRRKP